MRRRPLMKLSFDTKKIFQNGPKDPAVLAGAIIVYGVAMAAAVIKSVQENKGREEKPESE